MATWLTQQLISHGKVKLETELVRVHSDGSSKATRPESQDTERVPGTPSLSQVKSVHACSVNVRIMIALQPKTVQCKSHQGLLGQGKI